MGNGPSRSRRHGVLLETLEEHEAEINCLAVSEDGSLVVSGSEDGTTRLWSTRSDVTECIGVLQGHSGFVSCVAVRDTTVVTASGDGTVRRWDMSTGLCTFIYEGHTSRIQKLLVTEHFIFTSSYDKTARAWLLDTSHIMPGDERAACIQTFVGHKKGVNPILFAPSEDFDLTDGATVNPGDMVITGSTDATARSWSLETGGMLKTFTGHIGAVTAMVLDGSNKVLYTCGADGSVKSWDLASGQMLKVMRGHSRMILDMTMSPDKAYLFTGSVDRHARSWMPENGDTVRIFEGAYRSVVMVHCKGNTLFTGSGDGIVRAYDAKSGHIRKIFDAHSGAVSCLVVSGSKIYTGSWDGKLRVWDGKELDLGMIEPVVPILPPDADEESQAGIMATVANPEDQLFSLEDEKQSMEDLKLNEEAEADITQLKNEE